MIVVSEYGRNSGYPHCNRGYPAGPKHVARAWPDLKVSCGQTAPYARFYGSICEVLEAIATVWVGKIAGLAEDNL